MWKGCVTDIKEFLLKYCNIKFKGIVKGIVEPEIQMY